MMDPNGHASPLVSDHSQNNSANKHAEELDVEESKSNRGQFFTRNRKGLEARNSDGSKEDNVIDIDKVSQCRHEYGRRKTVLKKLHVSQVEIRGRKRR